MGDAWLISRLKGQCNPQIYAPQRRHLERWFECAQEVRKARPHTVGGPGLLCKALLAHLSIQTCWQV